VDFRERLDVDVSIDLGGFETGVTEHFLDVADVSAVDVHVGGHAVPQKMACAGFGDAGLFELAGNPGAEVGGGDAGAVAT
jgi:hypothetical protein